MIDQTQMTISVEAKMSASGLPHSLRVPRYRAATTQAMSSDDSNCRNCSDGSYLAAADCGLREQRGEPDHCGNQ